MSSEQKPQPPRWVQRLLQYRLPTGLSEEVQGDLDELFDLWVDEMGIQKARWKYIGQVLGFLRPLPERKQSYIPRDVLPPSLLTTPSPITQISMFRNYFKIAFRNLTRNKGYSFINIGGLAIGMAVAMLIGLWIYDEVSFDRYHKNYDRIAQVVQNQTIDGRVQTWLGQAMQLGPAIESSYGNYFKHIVRTSWPGDHILKAGDKTLVKSGMYMEPGGPEMLSLVKIRGSMDGLKDPYSILLSETVAQAIFGDSDPIGRLIKIDNKMDVKVTGVYKDLPVNSTFANITFIAPWDLLISSENLKDKVGWGNSWFQTFVQVSDKVDMNQASEKIKYVKRDNIKVDRDDLRFKPEMFLHPMSQWHLYSEFENGVSVGGKIRFVWLFGIIGAFVLILACINFMNLSTARSEKRAKEVGVRKVVGSERIQLIWQFLGESLLVAFFSLVIAILLVVLTLPLFNEIADKKISILWVSPWFWLSCIIFCLFTGLIAGSYPALYLSSFHPVKVLKGTFRVGRFAAAPRKVLVVLQFTVSVFLIVGTLVVFRQIQFVKDRPLGYDRNGLLTIPMKTQESHDHYNAFQNDLMNTRMVSSMAQSESAITNAWVTNGGFQWKGKDPGLQDEIVTVGVTHHFGKTVDWKIKSGRDFSEAFSTDSSGFILNEAAVKYMGFKQPLGEVVKAFGGKYTVIGVVKDMVTQSIYDPVRPTIFYIDTFKRLSLIDIKISPQANTSQAIDKIKTLFLKHNPATPFDYRFADEEFAAKYKEEERIGKLASIFATLAIFISCLGLFGLASFVAEQRTKEIGIRKVLGATVISLWQLLSREFVWLVLIAFIIATPLAWYFLNSWLQDYQYRTNIPGWIFAATGLGLLLITLLTVSFQAVKAALINPVKSLRNE
ncbi:ABC transporter permease [Xanthocytophaga flava]|uniref:ABC transporter permease n=1 Tax=Xanthocytophaga flava TaxID=3048013 RepID=UPI0028D0C886|nr:ABC transporter permease [Xanthocytophaga flavus]MDJ1471345.1 ABC transporter permease [Xanthocytophaga flavus]